MRSVEIVRRARRVEPIAMPIMAPVERREVEAEDVAAERRAWALGVRMEIRDMSVRASWEKMA